MVPLRLGEVNLPHLLFVIKVFSILVVVASSAVPRLGKRVGSEWMSRPLPPGPLIIGYAHNAASGKVDEAIRSGMNVVCWSFVNMVADRDGATFTTDLDMEGVRTIRERFAHVLHIAAIGGWNGPHPPRGASGKEWCSKFVQFNKAHGFVFDGVDWDLEGHDDTSGPTSSFTLETLNIMADFSVQAKSTHGLIVSLAPAESYLDALVGEGDNSFSLDLNLPPSAWMDDPNDRAVVDSASFSHAGKQCYAYVLHRAGIGTFDWVSLQLYEAYSRFVHDTTRRKPQPIPEVDALLLRAESLQNGYSVELPEYGTVQVAVPLSKLVFGVGNGWVDGEKFCKVELSSLSSAFGTLQARHGEGYRGAMFWTVDEEGTGGLHMSAALASVFYRSKESGL